MSTLCSVCTEAFRTVRSHTTPWTSGQQPRLFQWQNDVDAWEGSHHLDTGSFLRSCSRRCYICSTLHRDCRGEIRRRSRDFRTFYRITRTSGERYVLEFTIEILPSRDQVGQVVEPRGKFLIVPEKDAEVAGLAQLRKLSGRADSHENKEQVKSWLRNCDRGHDVCKRRWKTTNDFQLRLLTFDPNNLDLVRLEEFQAHQARPSYVTLSHCWGAKRAQISAHQLGDNTFLKLKSGIKVKLLPTKLQDAITVAAWFGVQHLWVDAMCINQDSEKDWYEQSSRMGDIYMNSYCNIAATAEGRGLFNVRPTEMVEAQTIQSLEDPTTEHVLIYDDLWSNSLLQPPLHKRAWVLPERLNSPRTIHFGLEQLFFECRCLKACEAHPNGLPSILMNGRTEAWRQTDPMFSCREDVLVPTTLRQRFLNSLKSWTHWPAAQPTCSQRQTAYQAWSKTVEQYMRCGLTEETDKLIAISGIAQRIAAITGEAYLAGHWDNELLPQSLLWYVPSRRKADGTNSFRTWPNAKNVYRAPSWSWASMEAEVTWNWPAPCHEPLIEVVGKSTTPHPGSRLGAVLGAELTIKGVLFAAKLRLLRTGAKAAQEGEESGQYILEVDQNPNPSDGQDYDPFELERYELPPGATHIYLDEPLLTPDRKRLTDNSLIYLLPICPQWQGRSGATPVCVAGLILRQLPGNERYSRVGIFGLEDREAGKLYKRHKDDSEVFNENTVRRHDQTTFTMV